MSTSLSKTQSFTNPLFPLFAAFNCTNFLSRHGKICRLRWTQFFDRYNLVQSQVKVDMHVYTDMHTRERERERERIATLPVVCDIERQLAGKN